MSTTAKSPMLLMSLTRLLGLQGADVKGECLEVEDKVLLSSSADWVDFPDLLLLPHNGRTFEIKACSWTLFPH